MNRRLTAALLAAVPLIGLVLLQLPPPVLVALLVADVGVLGWAAAGYRTHRSGVTTSIPDQAGRLPVRSQRARRPPPQRYFDPDTGEIFTDPDRLPQRTNQQSAVARHATADTRLAVDRTDTRTDTTVHVRTGLGDALRQALGVDDERSDG